MLKSTVLVDDIESFAEDFQIDDDPVEERLYPQSKSTRIGINCRNLISFLGDNDIMDKIDTSRSLDFCRVLEEDLKRCQRVTWLLFRYDIFFHPKLGGRTRGVTLEGEQVDCHYEIAVIKDNFVLAEKREVDIETRPISSSDNPIKIRVPRLANSLLKVGDNLHVGITKVVKSDYWVIKSVSGVQSLTKNYMPTWVGGSPVVDGLSSRLGQLKVQDSAAAPEAQTEGDPNSRDEIVNSIRADPEYKKRMEALLNTSPPADPFPEEQFTEEWFSARELDIDSDEEIPGIWCDSDEDDDDEDDEDDDSDSEED